MRAGTHLQKALVALALGPAVGAMALCDRMGVSLERSIALGALIAAFTSPLTFPIMCLAGVVGLVAGPPNSETTDKEPNDDHA